MVEKNGSKVFWSRNGAWRIGYFNKKVLSLVVEDLFHILGAYPIKSQIGGDDDHDALV